MRQHLIALAVLAGSAHAEKLDMKADAAHVDVYRDETGKYYVIPKDGERAGDPARKWTFYGDGRTMYRQRVIGYSTAGGEVSISVWAPRVKNVPHATLTKNKDGVYLVCRMKDSKHERRPLTLVAESDAKKLFDKAVFEPPLWVRRVYFFGRGEGTTYYLVDTLEDGQGFRLFVGQKGQMKQVTISDFASDTGGASVMTKTGELVIPTGEGAATWNQGKKQVAISRLEAGKNAYLIYRDLGVYGQLGTFCEDQ